MIVSLKYMDFFHSDWAAGRGINGNLEEKSKQELDDNLRQFYAEARNKSGANYSRSTLLCLRNGIERYLNNPPFKKGIHIATDPAFQLSNQMLDAKLKVMKQQGEENVKHKPCIEREDLRRLKESDVMSPSTPQGLLNNVWFHITLYFCRRGREGQRNLKKTSFVFLQDENGSPYATMAHDEASKTRQGGLDDNTSSYEKLGRMYKTDHPNDGYTALQLYLQKLHPDCSAFFQFPKRLWSGPQEPVWFENRCLGVNKLGGMMKALSEAAKLSQVYTNHCVRATAITLWSDAGLSNRHIMSISGHRNENSLRSYNARPSSNQLQLCSNVLSTALNPAEQQLQIQQQNLPPALSPNAVTVPSQNIFSRHDERVTFASMFSGCQIGNVHVNLGRDHCQ